MKILIALLSFIMLYSSEPKKLKIQSGFKKISVLELYTSTTRKDCVDAEEYLHSFKQDELFLHKVIPVAFHVDYWDNEDKRDKYTQIAFTKRQYDYSMVWKKPTVRTPSFILNGVEHKSWFMNNLPIEETSKETAGLLQIEELSKFISVDFRMPSSNTIYSNEDMLVDAVVIEIHDENRSVNPHSFIAVGITSKTVIMHAGVLKTKIRIPKYKVKPQRKYVLAVWVSNKKREVLQAVGGRI